MREEGASWRTWSEDEIHQADARAWVGVWGIAPSAADSMLETPASFLESARRHLEPQERAFAASVPPAPLSGPGADHGETLDLLLHLSLDRKELERNSAHLAQLLGVKSASEYEERLLTAKDAVAATKHLDRLRPWARSKLP